MKQRQIAGILWIESSSTLRYERSFVARKPKEFLRLRGRSSGKAICRKWGRDVLRILV